MITIPSNNSVWFDVDDTLVLWSPTPEEKEKYGIDVNCPGSKILNKDGTVDEAPGWVERLVPHFTHVEQIKKHKARGHTVIVWSAGGWEWARAAVMALGLERYVDLVISKPEWVVDDLPVEKFMPKSQYAKNVFPVLEEKNDFQ